jgi:hypothetical protein
MSANGPLRSAHPAARQGGGLSMTAPGRSEALIPQPARAEGCQ